MALNGRRRAKRSPSCAGLHLDAALLGGGILESVYWRPSCGNDELNVDVDRQIVPEASTLVSWGLLAFCAALGMVFNKRRKRVLAPVSQRG